MSPDLPSAFAHSAAYGDMIAATLALLSLVSLPSGPGVLITWIFNLWGSADLLNAFYQANATGLSPGQLGGGALLKRERVDFDKRSTSFGEESIGRARASLDE